MGVPERFENGEPTGESAIWDVSVELVDIQGNSRGWFLKDPPIGWHEYWILVGLGDQEGFDFVESGPFDVTQVTQIRLDESGFVVDFPPAPPGTRQDIWDWNAWDHFRVERVPLQAGDANEDYVFDEKDIVIVLQANKYRTGMPATWEEGDWNGAPGGYAGNPPIGDGVFDEKISWPHFKPPSTCRARTAPYLLIKRPLPHVKNSLIDYLETQTKMAILTRSMFRTY